MRVSLRFFFGGIAIVVLAACGSPTDSLDFKVPPGYTTKAQMGLMQVWEGSDPKQVLMLMKLPVAVDITTAMKSADMKDAKVESSQDVVICNGQKAKMITATGSSSANANKEDDSVDILMTAVGGSTYMAMYVRPQNAPVDSAALNALKTVCTK